MRVSLSELDRQYCESHQIPSQPEMELDADQLAEARVIWKRQKPDLSDEEINSHAIGTVAAAMYGVPKGENLEAARQELDSGRVVKMFECTRYIHGEQLPELITEAQKIEPAIKAAAESVNARLQALADLQRDDTDEHAKEFRNDFQQAEARFYAKAKKVVIGALILGVLVLILGTVFAVRAHAQIDVIKFQEAGVTKATKAGPFTINFSSGCVVTPVAAVIGVACSGGAGGSPGGSGTELQYRGGASTFSAVTGSSVSGGKVTFGDSIFLPDGTAALPSYSFTNATDSGFYHTGSGIIGFSRLGTTSMLFSSSGMIVFPATGVLSFTLGTVFNSQDTGLSRCAALVVCFGNSTSADFSATGKATIFNAVTGFRINNAATSGRFLKGDGTNFIVSSGSASGTGACAAGSFASTLNSDAAPTCGTAVTSVALTGTSQMTITGSPVTSTGTLGFTFASSGNTVDLNNPSVQRPNIRIARWILATNGGNVSTMGVSSSETGGGGTGGSAAPTSALPQMVTETTGAVSGNTGGILSGSMLVTGRTNGNRIQIGGQISTAATMREFYGITDQTTANMLLSDVPAGKYAGIMASTNGAYTLLTDTTHYVCIQKDNTTQTAVNSGVTFDNAYHKMEVFEDISAGAYRYYIDGVEKCSAPTTNKPPSGTAVQMIHGAATLTTAGIVIKTAYLWGEGDF